MDEGRAANRIYFHITLTPNRLRSDVPAARYWIKGIVIPVVLVGITTAVCVLIGVRNGFDTGPLSLGVTVAIGAYGCMVLTERRQTMLKVLITLCYFAGLVFFWFNMTVVSAALFGSRGNF